MLLTVEVYNSSSGEKIGDTYTINELFDYSTNELKRKIILLLYDYSRKYDINLLFLDYLVTDLEKNRILDLRV